MEVLLMKMSREDGAVKQEEYITQTACHEDGFCPKSSQEEGLESALEENERLKTMIKQIQENYKSLQLRFLEMLQQGSAIEGAEEEPELVSLSLGRSPTGSKRDDQKRTTTTTNRKTEADDDDHNINGGLTLGLELDPKFLLSTENNSELPKEEDDDAGETWQPASKVQKNTSGDHHEEEVGHKSQVKRARVSVRTKCEALTGQNLVDSRHARPATYQVAMHAQRPGRSPCMPCDLPATPMHAQRPPCTPMNAQRPPCMPRHVQRPPCTAMHAQRPPCTPSSPKVTMQSMLGLNNVGPCRIGSHTILSTCSCSGEPIPPAPRVIPLTSAQETHACSFDGLRYRFMICPNPVKYAAVPLEEDDDIGTMVRLHELTNIAVIELFVDVHNICDVPGSSRGVAQNPSEMTLYSQFEEPTYRFPNSFMALLESVNEVGGTSATEECETRNIPELVVDIDAENRWGEIHDDSSEDEETEEPVLGGDENIFGGGAIDEVPAPYEATPHMYEIDYDAMRAPEFPDMPHLPPYQMTASFDNSGEFSVGVQFRGKNEATLAIKEYCIKCHVDIHVAESNQKTLYAKCVKWPRVQVEDQSVEKSKARCLGHHEAMVEKDPRISCSVLAASIRSQFGYQVKYGKVWNAKMKAMKLTYGDWDTSYNELPHLLQAMKRFIPGTIVKSQTMPAYDEEGQLLPGKKIFHRLFWAFKACIEGFPFCKRMIQVDGTWLYGQYRHVLLMAVAQDGERNIFPIAFAIVEGETTEAWDFFLTNLRQYVVREDGVCLISDRGTGILAAIERPGSRWIPPYAYPTYCIRHIGKNSIDQFHNAHIRSEIVSMGYELRRPNFDKRLENLKVFYDDQRVWKWASKIPREKWSQAYDEGRRYGHMTTNLAEAINSILKGTRHLPIASVMKETYFRLGKVWSDKGKEIESLINRGKTWAPTVVESMEANERLATSMVVHNFDRVGHTFVVSCIRRNVGGEDQTFRVDLRHKWCDCGRFQAWKYPCAHAVAACMYAGVSAYTYVDECFHLRRILNVYSYEFRQIPNESYWLRKDHDEWLPNPMLRRSPKGRPESTRIHTSMDFHARERGQTKRCGLCRGEGHSKNNCPNLPRYRPHH
ncbi:hypothetical protein F3Y22_tig00111841pilonHSYRG00069 [Hibiscus syriacus]|uniref:SWIM-type domain-containing protein n=1 Tax=Hibiscus syriacus TaxID=106335 RepID=A0A6A2XRD8_HIBSY|nr:hypothetical protein F3Y22_tig00111841pilonHSYRG00069 [Hibiscus syriacus]